MPAPVIYRSTDTNAPVLFGGAGSLISLLDAILVNGYGSAFAGGLLASDGVNVTAGDTVTIGSITYTFQASVASGPAFTVLIGGSANGTFLNLMHAVNGTGTVGSHYTAGTTLHPDVWATVPPALIFTINARKGGSAGNSIALAESSTHLTVSGATLTGGGGSDTKAGASWTKPYSGTPSWQQRVYRQPAGCGFYLQVDDSGPGTGVGREARCFGFEAMTAYNTGSGQFPTVAQIAAGSVLRKSNTLDGTVRSWIAFADDRTFYLFTLTGDSAGNYHGFTFGDFYSLVPGEAYKCLIASGSNEAAGSATTSLFGQMAAGLPTSATGHWLPRNYSGIGGSTNFVKIGDISLTAGAGVTTAMSGVIGFPNAPDGGFYVAPLRIVDGSSPGTSILGTPYLRGRMRGLYQVCHPLAQFADGDIFSGSGDYAGRTFQIVKHLHSSSASQAFAAIETTAWETSA